MKNNYLFILLFFSFATNCLSLPADGHSSRDAMHGVSTHGFIENKGQIIDQDNKPNPGVLYFLNTPGFNVQLRRGGFSYDLYTASGCGPRASGSKLQASGFQNSEELPDFAKIARSPQPVACSMQPVACSLRFSRIDFNLAGSNPDCKIIASGQSSEYFNYYTSGTPVDGVTEVRSYQSITYRDIYPGVDLEFISGGKETFKYNFIVKPGGSLSSIRFNVSVFFCPW